MVARIREDGALNPLVEQIHSNEQRVVIKKLAEAAAVDECNFLEIGSWCGDSTLILAEVAKNSGGKVYCVDWWRGNADTELENIAKELDVFQIFWNRILSNGYENTVIPLRGASFDIVALLRDEVFDFVFIDADHRYDSVRQDIAESLRLVKPNGGILSGHDCEGQVSDYEREFLDLGKEVDLYEGVHCGVVLAVGERFSDYSLNHAVWSVRKGAGDSDWQSTLLEFEGISDYRQTPPPPIGICKGFNIFRYGSQVIALPDELGYIDFRATAPDTVESAILASSIKQIEEILNQKVLPPPRQIAQFDNFLIRESAGRIFLQSEDIEPISLVNEDLDKLKELESAGKLVYLADSGKASDLTITDILKARNDAAKVRSNQLEEKIQLLNEQIRQKVVEINKLLEDWELRGLRIRELENNLSKRDSESTDVNPKVGNILDSLEKDWEARGARIQELEAILSERDALDRYQIQQTTKVLENLEKDWEARGARIQELETILAEREARDSEQIRKILSEFQRLSKDWESRGLRIQELESILSQYNSNNTAEG